MTETHSTLRTKARVPYGDTLNILEQKEKKQGNPSDVRRILMRLAVFKFLDQIRLNQRDPVIANLLTGGVQGPALAPGRVWLIAFKKHKETRVKKKV